MRGGGMGATLEAFAIPLGSTDILSNALSPAAFGRSASKYPVAAGLRLRANEAAGMARNTNDAKATFTEVFDMVAPLFTGTPYLGADVGLQAAAAIKLYFREHFGAFVRTESICTEEVENRGTKGSLGLSAGRRLPRSKGDHRPRPPSLASKSGKVNSLHASLSPLQFDPAAYFNQRARGYLEPVDGVCRIARHE
jgi:hypothetical protein